MPPLGLLYVASYLEHFGVEVKVIDRSEEYTSDSSYTGIGFMSNQFSKVKQIAREVKEQKPDTIIVAGGVHPTVATDEVISEPDIDIAVVGEGERAMLRIIEEGIQKGVVQGEMFQNLDCLPFPARHLIDMDWYLKHDTVVPFLWSRATTIMTSLGCPFACNFCINSKYKMFGAKVRYHSQEYVESEIRELISTYKNLEGLHLVDDTFTLNEKRVLAICRVLKKFDLRWFAQARVGTLNHSMLSSMERSGCVGLGFGVESGSERVLRALNKSIRVEDTIKTFDMCKEVGIKTFANVIIGSPEEEREDIELTDKLLGRIQPDFTGVWHLTPYQGTVIYDQAMQNGWIRGSSLTCDEPQMEINFTLEELEEIRKDLMSKHNPFSKKIRPYLSSRFVYDMILLFLKKPSLVTKGVKAWEEEASRKN